MTIDCNLTITGILPEDSMNAFMRSYYQTSKVSHYKKYQNQMQQYFKNKMDKSVDSSDIKVKGLSSSFKMDIKNDKIEFLTTMPDTVNKYEYGSDTTPPRRFVEPVILDVANKMSEKIIDEAIDMYNKNVITTVKTKSFSLIPKVKK